VTVSVPMNLLGAGGQQLLSSCRLAYVLPPLSSMYCAGYYEETDKYTVRICDSKFINIVIYIYVSCTFEFHVHLISFTCEFVI